MNLRAIFSNHESRDPSTFFSYLYKFVFAVLIASCTVHAGDLVPRQHSRKTANHQLHKRGQNESVGDPEGKNNKVSDSESRASVSGLSNDTVSTSNGYRKPRSEPKSPKKHRKIVTDELKAFIKIFENLLKDTPKPQTFVVKPSKKPKRVQRKPMVGAQ